MSPAHRLIQRAKWLVAWLLRLTGVLRRLRAGRARRGEVMVLWLHRVDGTPDRRVPMGIPPEVFTGLLDGLGRRYRVGRWDECVRATGGADAPHVAITFDDGYLDNATIAWPALESRGLTGIFLLTTDFVAGTMPLWWERVAAAHLPPHAPYPVDPNGEATYGAAAERRIDALKALPDLERRREVDAIDARGETPPALDFERARAMARAGAEIGGHTRTHPLLPRCDDDVLADELRSSNDTLERELGSRPALFAYPNGSLDERVVTAVRAAGYTHAFTTEKGVFARSTDPLRIPRIGVSEPRYSLDGRSFSWTLFEAEMLGVFDALLLRRMRRRRS